ncbi:hypothetical protein ACO0LC_11030 [Undibacterium sp. JH2W]|uniref:hypothetical protein n=1 Tax=Undibacterium sp. JH2W TaxID=3413037 RepID=UPI003BF2025E
MYRHLPYLSSFAALAFCMSASAEDMRCTKPEVANDFSACYKLSEMRMNGSVRSFPMHQVRGDKTPGELMKSPFTTVYDCKTEMMEFREDEQLFWGPVKANSATSKKWRDSICEEKNVTVDEKLRMP